MANEKSRGAGRTRNWTIVIYPTDGTPPAPANWRDIIDQEHIPWIESPLHDRDTNANGEPKKPHIHILLNYESVKSYEQVKSLCDRLNAPIPQRAAGARALVRYFAHLDNPEKAQYNVADIIGHGGADVAELLRPSSSERYQLIREMIAWCRDNSITEFSDLIEFAMDQRFDTWFPLLCDNSAYVISATLKSYRHRPIKPGPAPEADPSTGEVITHD
jgi:cytochrome c